MGPAWLTVGITNAVEIRTAASAKRGLNMSRLLVFATRSRWGAEGDAPRRSVQMVPNQP